MQEQADETAAMEELHSTNWDGMAEGAVVVPARKSKQKGSASLRKPSPAMLR